MEGQTLSHYRILDRLGRGGMGTVYRAEDLQRSRHVAIKVLQVDRVGGDSAIQRLKREALACVTLRHPNITEVFEVAESGGVFYIAMELVEGETLRAMLERGHLSWAEIVGIGRQVSSALARAHRQGLVHRDIKPENVMVGPEGRVKVLDFGLVIDVPPESVDDVLERTTLIEGGTRHDAVVGTMGYLSPEQAQGRKTGPASDVFSLGVVLYEMACGRLPFRAENPATWIHAIVYERPEPLRVFRPDVPPDLEAIVGRAMEKRVERRFADGEAMEKALVTLEAALRDLVPRRPEVAAPPPGVPSPVPVASHGRMVGRQVEFDMLREMQRSVGGGRGRAAWVAGEAGCGKSRLLEEMAAHGERAGMLVLWGNGRVREGVRPYHPFAEIFAGYLGPRAIRRYEGLRDHLEAVEPGLGRWGVVLANLLQLEAPGLEAPVNREQILDGVGAVLAALSRRQPVLLLLNDLHWADAETLDLVHFLLPILDRARILLIGCYRPEELVSGEGKEHPLARLLGRAERQAGTARITLRRLEREETGELAEEAVGGELPSEFLDDLHRRTEGNPLFALELLKVLRAEGLLQPRPGGGFRVLARGDAALPGRVRDLIDRRLRALSHDQRRVLEVAAVEGAVFHSAILATCLGMDRMQVLDHLQTLERDLQLVRAEDEGYRFDHPLIRDVLMEGILPELRREYHRRIGENLIRLHGERPEHAAAIAYQLREARDDQAALPFLLAAARAARLVFSNEVAIGYLDAAERILLDRDDGAEEPAVRRDLMKVHERRGELLQMVGRTQQALEDFARLEERAGRAGDGLRQAMACNRLGMVHALRGDYDAALEDAGRARRAAAGDERALAEAGEVEGLVHYHQGAFEAALGCQTEAMRLRKRIGDEAGVAHNLNKIGNIRYYQGEYEAALAAYRAALVMEREMADQRGTAESLMNLGATYLQMGDTAAALQHHQAALAIKREIGDRRSIAMSLNNLALVQEARGRLVEARAFHEESLGIKREIGDQRGISTSLSNLAALLERMGYLEQSLHAAQESLAIKEAIEDRMSVPYALNQIGGVLLALGRYEEADRRHRDALEITRSVGDRTEEAHSLRRRGEVRLEQGDAAGACGPLAEALALARDVGAREGEREALYALGQAQLRAGRIASARETVATLRARGEGASAEFQAKEQRLRGLVAAAEDRSEDARRCFRAALDLAADVGLRDLQWRLHVDLAQALSSRGASAEADQELARARMILEDLAARFSDPEARRGFLGRPGAAAAVGPLGDPPAK